MISNIIDAEKLNDDVDEKTADDEDKTEVLVTVENLPSKSMVQQNKKKRNKGVFNKEWLKIAKYQRYLKDSWTSFFTVLGIIDLIDDADESAIKIFANARQFLLDNGLDMHGLTVLGADNTNVNVGHNHSVYSLFKDEVPDILKGNCYNHILHNSVKHAHLVLTIDIEQILLSIYSHFSRSAKRVNELQQYYEFYEQDFKNENIEALTWNQVIQFVDMLKIKDLNEDCLFDEFTNIKLIFKTISDQSVPIFNQVQAFVRKKMI
ncbi:unnamed protein product [Rotaria sp. Silwood1]|nr:unnamed protein product [Rotaria sp. Silwood1]